MVPPDNAAPQSPPPPEALQFTRAEAVSAAAVNAPRCVACKLPLVDTYFHVHGRQVCPTCTGRIRSDQEAPPTHLLLKSALYGGAAALAGCIIYATVTVTTHLEIGLIAILVGYMVGKAIRHASRGLGGRPQQIMAVLLTYFAISFSYVTVFIVRGVQAQAATHALASATASVTPIETAGPPKAGVVPLLLTLLWLGLAAPFLALTNAMNLISLFIIFIGLRQAWLLTGRSNLLIMGPYQTSALVD